MPIDTKPAPPLPMPPGLAAFLSEYETLKDTLRYQRLDELQSYFDGTQYEDRELDAEGYRKGAPGIYGTASRTPPWDERDVGCVWNLRQEVVEELTNWSVAGEAWCALKVPDDAEAEDWIVTVANSANMCDIVAKARNFGGSQGTMIVSFGVVEGEYLLEAHNPKQMWVVAWRNEMLHRPAAVAKVYQADDQLAKRRDKLPVMCRYWDEYAEIYYRRVFNERQKVWEWIEQSHVVHGLKSCPVYWHPNAGQDGTHDGREDGFNTSKEIDQSNYLFAAGSLTTMRNADDTLVIDTPPGSVAPGEKIRKGGFNVITAKSASYLSQEGDSARICVELSEKLGDRVYRRAGVVMVDPANLASQSSAEMLKRLYQRTLASAGTIRRDVARGLVIPLCRGLLDSARIIGPAGLRIPPKVVQGKEGQPPTITPRLPGTSSFVECIWPEPFPPTSQDKLVASQTAVAATGGKQVLSQETAVTFLASAGLPITNVDQELARIAADTTAAAEASASALGLAAEAEGKAGGLDEKEDDPGARGDEKAAE